MVGVEQVYMFASFSILRDRFHQCCRTPSFVFIPDVYLQPLRKKEWNKLTGNNGDTLAYLVHSTAGLLLTP